LPHYLLFRQRLFISRISTLIIIIIYSHDFDDIIISLIIFYYDARYADDCRH